MAHIRILDDETINKIAAGEVIENPASVVKELIENAIDADATEISIEINNGGRQLIRISDNGKGMSAEDALLCLKRHATSKIQNVEDIEDLMTMGFRGEAIPSIASISKFTILTTLNQPGKKQHEGTLIQVEGGKLLSSSPATRSPGTTVEVKSLFFNVPVRKKFQKSPSYDTQEILKMISVLALGYPTIKFELISDQKLLLTTPLLPPDHSFQEQLNYRIENVLGKEFFSALCPIAWEQEGCQLNGFIGLPQFNRPNKTGQYLFINQRAVQSPLISFAVRDGYATMLPNNRYPIFVLHIKLPGSLIDVNVHPQKKEVRLRQEQHLKEAIRENIQRALQKDVLLPESPSPTEDWPIYPRYETLLAPSPVSFEEPKQQPYFQMKPFSPPSSAPVFEVREAAPTFNFAAPAAPTFRILALIPGHILLDPGSLTHSTFASLGIKGTEGFVLVNQRAAYARIYYERLATQQTLDAKKSSNAQMLLVPVTLDLSLLEAALLKEYLAELNNMGFGIQEFGAQTFVIDAIPEFLQQEEIETSLKAIVHDLKEFQDSRRLQKEKDKCLALAACRDARAATKRLSHEEATILMNQLVKCQVPTQCPLGRPTFAYFSAETLAKPFQLS